MAESIVSSIVERVADLLIKEGQFLVEVKDQVESLQNELKLMQGLLEDADERQDKDNCIRQWVSQIRDLAYEAEDVIEAYILKVAQPTDSKNYLTRLCICFEIHRSGKDIEKIRSRVSDLARIMQAYGIIRTTPDQRSPRSPPRVPHRVCLPHVDEVFVGMEDSIQDIVEKVVMVSSTGRHRHHRVVCIYGMGGLGKTSLAKKVYDDQDVRGRFDCFAWARVSKQFNEKKVLVKILSELIPTRQAEISGMQKETLSKTLYGVLQEEKRCLIVLDDIWTEEAWKSLKDAFPMENMRSNMILLTTRNPELAAEVRIAHSGYVHEPRYLSDEERWELLKKKAFPKREGEDECVIRAEMETLGKSMLTQTGGLPLAVVVLGGVLARKKTLIEWDAVQRNMPIEQKDEVSNILALGYRDLPHHLKLCFNYLASFPKDVAIPVRKLMHMWIAEGFFHSTAYRSSEKRTVEEDAYGALNELNNRGLLQAQISKSTGEFKTCHLHDLMRDFCDHKAKEEKFLNVINLQNIEGRPIVSPPPSANNSKVRRLSIYLGDMTEYDLLDSLMSSLGNTSHLRALLLPSTSEGKCWKKMQTHFMNCKLLRLLDMEGFFILERALSKSVSDLIHLRYLNLRNTTVEELPVSLGNLQLMETLDLRVRSEVRIANVLWKMKRLRYLYLPLCFSVTGGGSEKLQLYSLNCLEILKNFSPSKCNVKDLRNLLNLRRFSACPLEVDDGKGVEQVLEIGEVALGHIQYTSFRISSGGFSESDLENLSGYGHPCNLYLEGSIQKLPDDDKQFPKRIRKLILKHSKLKEDSMSKLEKLQTLMILHLLEDAYVGKEITVSSRGFPDLKSLVLCKLSSLEGFRVEQGALFNLSHLEISNCPSMKRVGGLSSLAERQKLEFFYVTAEGRFRVAREGKSWVYYTEEGAVVRQEIGEARFELHSSDFAAHVEGGGSIHLCSLDSDELMEAPEFLKKADEEIMEEELVARLIKSFKSMKPVRPLHDEEDGDEEDGARRMETRRNSWKMMD
ncbi:hypothetical protein SAY87_014527 [Trapa incisa]|uniref:Uncharacterized protein n=1 Tax=Trapa incisa TaxID=236973 RepID=A0AAN7GK52_9MYRT|nr:hypothetical protein SAY87_014527 [Trapa incisa]